MSSSNLFISLIENFLASFIESTPAPIKGDLPSPMIIGAVNI